MIVANKEKDEKVEVDVKVVTMVWWWLLQWLIRSCNHLQPELKTTLLASTYKDYSPAWQLLQQGKSYQLTIGVRHE
jgi:hypothetical protein